MRELYDAMTHGAVHRPVVASRKTYIASRWPERSGSAARSVLRANGSNTTLRRDGSASSASIWERIESIVPPLKPPLRLVTSSVVSPRPPSPRRSASRWSRWTPRSDGIESNPQEVTMRAPVRTAVSCAGSTASRTNSTSPVRSA